MDTLTTRTHAFGTSVSVDEIEERLIEWPSASDTDAETVLDFAECRHIDMGAGFRLTNAMRRWATGRLIVRIGAELDIRGGDWFLLFTRSGVGWAIAAHADVVLAGERDVAVEIRAYYEAASSRSHASNCVMFLGIESGALVPSQDRFVSTVLQAMRGYLPHVHESVPAVERRALARLAHEAVTNVVDHAFASPWSAQGEPLAYLSVRWYRSISARSDDRGGLRSYIEAHAERLEPTDTIAGWIELVIADDGVGIPARHAQVEEATIYSGLRTSEDNALRAALRSSATVKLDTLDAQLRGEPGFGTAIMVECLERIGAYAALRTGRRLVEFDPWHHEQFELNEEGLGWLPGTVVQVVLPVLDAQLRLG